MKGAWPIVIVLLGVIGAATFITSRVISPQDKCTSVLFLNGRELSTDIALEKIKLTGKISNAAQEKIGERLQDYAQRTFTFCQMYKLGVISDVEYKERVVAIDRATQAIAEASSKGAFDSASFSESDLDAAIFRALGPQLALSFSVFFDFEQADLRENAKGLLNEIAAECSRLKSEGVDFVLSVKATRAYEESSGPLSSDQFAERYTVSAARLMSLVRYLRDKPEGAGCHVSAIVDVDVREVLDSENLLANPLGRVVTIQLVPIV